MKLFKSLKRFLRRNRPIPSDHKAMFDGHTVTLFTVGGKLITLDEQMDSREFNRRRLLGPAEVIPFPSRKS